MAAQKTRKRLRRNGCIDNTPLKTTFSAARAFPIVGRKKHASCRLESPAKAKTINKYLGSDYTVLASYGHVRDLPPKDGSVDPDHEFDMKWEIGADSRKHVKAIADALKDDNALILATDPDREGEAISWHLEEALRKRRAIKKDTPVSRVVLMRSPNPP